MSVLFFLLLLATLGGAALWLFVSTPPNKLASLARFGLPALLLVLGGLLTMIGRAGLGIPLLGFGIALLQRWRSSKPLSSPSGKTSTVRSAAFEMELDHDSGDMDGTVLIGQWEGQRLSNLQDDEIISLLSLVHEDGESSALLEAYLDRRMPRWREHTHTHGTGGSGGASASGPMTKEEAYQILGLKPGASAAEIRKAWRNLMKSVHPDSGGTAFLAAKLNEAKDILLD